MTNVFGLRPSQAAGNRDRPDRAGSGGPDSSAGGHEQVVFCHDGGSGLRAIIAVYSTALGPALGGTRFFPYAGEDAALADVLNLSAGMAYKNALAGLDHGGGKAVIIGDPATDKTEAVLRAYGRFVQSLSGRYITACDVGTYVSDMDVVARECEFVTGRSEASGGAGDSSVLTAYGVFEGMHAAVEHVWGPPSLAGKRVGIAGIGKVGRQLTEHLLAEGASVVATDVDERAIEWMRVHHPEVDILEDVDALVRSPLDVYAPCALGGALNDETAPVLDARVVCGGANNQLEHPGIEKMLADHGILYAPDYVVNSGGVIQVADEIHGFSFERAKAKAARIFQTARKIFHVASEEGVTPAVAAGWLAERRMAEVGRLRAIWLHDPAPSARVRD